jgi:hypothetical protein
MTADRRKQLLLGALGLVLAVVMYRAWIETSAAPGATSNDKRPAPSGDRTPNGTTARELDVHLRALDAERPQPGAAERDLFRFKPKAAPPPVVERPSSPAEAPSAAVPTGPPPPPPITLKYLGVMREEGKPELAVLSDGVGPPMFGYVGGPPVAGKYRILRVSTESVEISYLDGSGRTTIRMSGQ